MAEYIAVVHTDGASNFGASFPDFPGAITAANSLEELRIMAEEALSLHIEGMTEDGEDIPAPSSLDEVVQHEDYKDAIAVMVIKASDETVPSVRVNITVPDRMLKRIDSYAAEHGLTRSGFLVQAAKKEMETAKT
jgi:predicted RNase H-like HicB family nuclease